MSGTPVSNISPPIPLQAFRSTTMISITARFEPVGRMNTYNEPRFAYQQPERHVRDVWYSNNNPDADTRARSPSNGSSYRFPSGTPASNISPPVPLSVWKSPAFVPPKLPMYERPPLPELLHPLRPLRSFEEPVIGRRRREFEDPCEKLMKSCKPILPEPIKIEPIKFKMPEPIKMPTYESPITLRHRERDEDEFDPFKKLMKSVTPTLLEPIKLRTHEPEIPIFKPEPYKPTLDFGRKKRDEYEGPYEILKKSRKSILPEPIKIEPLPTVSLILGRRKKDEDLDPYEKFMKSYKPPEPIKIRSFEPKPFEPIKLEPIKMPEYKPLKMPHYEPPKIPEPWKPPQTFGLGDQDNPGEARRISGTEIERVRLDFGHGSHPYPHWNNEIYPLGDDGKVSRTKAIRRGILDHSPLEPQLPKNWWDK